MAITDKAVALGRKLKLDSHHGIERFGVFFGIFVVLGAIVVAGSGVSAVKSGRDALSKTALYTESFTTSKTNLDGDVDGVYTNASGDRALVIMHFSNTAQISYSASDYQAFIQGSDTNLNGETVSTSGVEGSFYVFGSTGYIGVLLDAAEPFDRQVLNLTMRANAELTFSESGLTDDEISDDASFAEFDQWRVFFNPGASEARPIAALDTLTFDPAQAYYDVVVKSKEDEARTALDTKLLAMRAGQAKIAAYTSDLETTKVDGLFLRPLTVPKSIAGDQVTGESASETADGVSTLALDAKTVVSGGFDFNWRAGNVYDGYLDALVPSDQNYAEFLSAKRAETTDTTTTQDISQLEWILSDGSSLTDDYQASDVTMRPLINVMNNLSQAYQDYASNKSDYQSDLMLDLLRLDIDLRDVQSNSSIREGDEFLLTYY